MSDQASEMRQGPENESKQPQVSNSAGGGSQSPSSKADAGCLKGAALGCGIVLVLFIGIAVAISLRFTNFMRYGLTQAILTMEKTIDVNKSINTEEYQELKNYLGALRQFVIANEMNRNNMVRYQTVAEAFRRALQDNTVGHSEIIAIRSAVQEAALETKAPAAVSETPLAETATPVTNVTPVNK